MNAKNVFVFLSDTVTVTGEEYLHCRGFIDFTSNFTETTHARQTLNARQHTKLPVDQGIVLIPF